MKISSENLRLLLFGEETERLYFREVLESDFEEWLLFCEFKDSLKYIWPENKLTGKELCRAWMDRIFMRYSENLGGMNALIDKENGQMVGQCGLLIQDIEGVRELEVGYSLMPGFRGKGYAYEAARKCRDYAFENDLTDSVISTIHVDNAASARVALKNGMKIEKTIIWNQLPVDIFKIEKSIWRELTLSETA